MKKLFQYQQDIVDSQKRPSSALYMDMGTGKTVTSLSLFKKSGMSKILIVCLVSKLDDWHDDLISECELDSIVLNKGSTKNNNIVSTSSSQAFIINYESSWRCQNLLSWVDNDTFVILDEAHKIKSHTSKVGKFADKLRLKTKHKCILTGTPQSKGYIDYFNQLKFVDIIPYTYKLFTETFCKYEVQNYTGFPFKKLVGYKNTELLDEIINDNCVFYKRDISNDLIPSDIPVALPMPAKYKGFKHVRIYEDYIADSAGKLFVGLRTLCSGFLGTHKVHDTRIQWLSDLVEDLNDRVVIFYNFNVERDAIIELLTKLDIPYSEYNGRCKDLTAFKENQNGVAVCQYMSASTGLNDLVCSHICVMYSLPLNYIDYRQAQKRIDRIGQTVKPLYYNLYCKGTVEEKIYDALKQGMSFDDDMFDYYMNNS